MNPSPLRSTQRTLTTRLAYHVRLLLLCVSAVPMASAHLMVAQQGTLNVVDDGVFMVMSVPTSAFIFADDDGDGKFSREEFTMHQADLRAAVTRGIQLRDSEGVRPLQGLMLTPVLSEDAPREPFTQLIAMGRFALSNPDSPLELSMQLFGTVSAERAQQITISRPADGRQQLLILTPERSTHTLFTSGWSTFSDYLVLGTEHIVLGIEAGQLLVAMLLAMVAITIQRLRGNAGLEFASHSAALLAIGMGGFWFVQRVI